MRSVYGLADAGVDDMDAQVGRTYSSHAEHALDLDISFM